jgi:LysM repeat protein
MRSMQSVVTGVVSVVLLIFVAAALVQAAGTNDGVTYGGVTYNLPKERSKIVLPANLPETVTVKKGDTLWGIAGEHLKDHFLWPLIWEANIDTVKNPHLIYPDQVLKMPKSGMLVATQGAESPAGAGQVQELPPGAQGRTDGDQTVQEYLDSFRVPLANATELDACGHITETQEELGAIIASEALVFQLSTNDIVYINLGDNDNVKAGDIFTIFSYTREVRHPHTGKSLGKLIRDKGRLKVICTQESTSTALIIKAYDSMTVGNKLRPYVPSESNIRQIPPETTICKPSSGELTGYIVDCRTGGTGISDGNLIGTDDVIYIDKGTAEGVALGQYFAAFKYRKNSTDRDAPIFQPISIGEIIIIFAGEKTSTALVTNALAPLSIGDIVDLKR